MNEVSLYVAAANAFWFAGISAHGPTIAIIQSCSSCKSCPDSGGSVTLCSDLPGLDPTVPQKVYFEMKMYAGYQHVCTVVYDEDGEYVATVYPAQGLRETTWIETSCAGGRLRGVAETVQQPTLEVDIEVEGNLVPPAVAGHFTFPQPEGCAGARKNYTYAIDNPDPEPDTPTELIAVTAVPHEGFRHVRWKGEGPIYDEYGNERTDVALDARDDEPERWVTDETIYLKCLDSDAGVQTKGGSGKKSSSSSSRSVIAQQTIDAHFVIFVDQPGAGGDRDSLEIDSNGEGDPGHTFFMLDVADVQSVPADLRPYCNTAMGFYPSASNDFDWKELMGRDTEGGDFVVGDTHHFEMYKKEQITGSNLLDALEFCKDLASNPPKYNLFKRNCTSVALEVASKAAVSPATGDLWGLYSPGFGPIMIRKGSFTLKWGDGYSSGILGEQLRPTAVLSTTYP